MIKQLRRLLAKIPTRLPQGLTEFETWSDDIIELYDMPNNDSIKFALAVTIMHLKPTESHLPKAYFGATLQKGAATQVAHRVMEDCKQRQAEAAAKAAQEAAEQEASKSSEATTLDVASNGSKD